MFEKSIADLVLLNILQREVFMISRIECKIGGSKDNNILELELLQ